MSVLNLIRWQNILLLILAQTLIKYALFPATFAQCTLSNLQFSILVICTILLASAGNIINDIYDVDIDKINKPNRVIVDRLISKKTAYVLFFICNFLGIAIGMFLAYTINKIALALIFPAISCILFWYAARLKRSFLLGNITVSLLVAFSLVIVGIFDLIPATTTANQNLPIDSFNIILGYATIAFLLNLSREIIKDIEDVNGDYSTGIKSLPIVMGRNRALNIAGAFTLLGLLLILYNIIINLYGLHVAVMYFMFLVVSPLTYFLVKLNSATHKTNYSHLSAVLKLVMLTGLLSLILYPLNLL